MNSIAAQSPDNTTTIILKFDNVAGNETLKPDSGMYTNAAGEHFSIRLLQYFISNLQFIDVNGKSYIVPQDSSYFLITTDDSASQSCLVHLPANEYKALSFIIGIDSLRSVSKIDQRKGVLDPSATDMYWGWNSGYIFLKMEGTSSAAPADPLGLHRFRYHVGGFGAYQSINNIKNVKLDLPGNSLNLKPGGKTLVRIKADILKIFDGPAQVSISQHNAVMFDTFSAILANNYAQMFSVDAVEN